MNQNQQGVSLIVTFLVMTIMLSMVLSITTILFNEIKIVMNMGSSISSLNSSDIGIEKTLYFDIKQVPVGANRGFCNICNTCSSLDCLNCTTTPLVANGCSVTNCTNCQITYDSSFDGRDYSVNARVSPNPLNANISDLIITSSGFYRDTKRVASYSSSAVYTAQNPLPTTTNISPSSRRQGRPGFNLLVTGTNFIASSVVNFNGSPRVTTFNSSTRLRAAIPASDLTVVGDYPITVTNPGPGGGTSNAQIFTVRP